MEKQIEEEKLKKAIFDGMSLKRQNQILNKGFDKWNPFEKPKDPIDIRGNKTKLTSKILIREFLQSQSICDYSNEYGQGVVQLCLGIINKDEKCLGMYDFACWYKERKNKS